MPLSIIKFHDEAPQLADSQEGFISMKLVKSRLSSEKACYLSVQYLLSSCLPSRNGSIKIYKNIILFFVCATETLLLALRERHCGCLDVRILVRMLDLRGRKWQDNGDHRIVSSFVISMISKY